MAFFYHSSTTEQQNQLVMKVHKQLLSVGRIQGKNVLGTEAVACSEKPVVAQKTLLTISCFYLPLFCLRFRILRMEVNCHISRFLIIILEIWVTVQLSCGSVNLFC